MAVFISHSFDNKPEFENIVDALELAKVPYWNPADVKPGSSLRDQLRQAVEHCNVCIFVATHRAVASSWCGAELGAFWGAGRSSCTWQILLCKRTSCPDSAGRCLGTKDWANSVPRKGTHE